MTTAEALPSAQDRRDGSLALLESAPFVQVVDLAERFGVCGAVALAPVCGVEDVDLMITSDDAPCPALDALEGRGLAVDVVGLDAAERPGSRAHPARTITRPLG